MASKIKKRAKKRAISKISKNSMSVFFKRPRPSARVRQAIERLGSDSF